MGSSHSHGLPLPSSPPALPPPIHTWLTLVRLCWLLSLLLQSGHVTFLALNHSSLLPRHSAALWETPLYWALPCPHLCVTLK